MNGLTPESPDPKKRVPGETIRRATDGKPFTGIERRRSPGIGLDLPENTNEVTVFHELGKALTSSLQLDQVLRTIMEKINEVLGRTPGRCS